MLATLASHCPPSHTHNSCGNSSSWQIPLIFLSSFFVGGGVRPQNLIGITCPYVSGGFEQGKGSFSVASTMRKRHLLSNNCELPTVHLQGGIMGSSPIWDKTQRTPVLGRTFADDTAGVNSHVQWLRLFQPLSFCCTSPSLCFYLLSFHSLFRVSWEEVVITVPVGTELSTTAYPWHPASHGISH